MILPATIPSASWVPTLLAAALLVDVIISVRPPAFVRDCLDGVGFPRDWWWILLAIKTAATTGLLLGLVVPGMALTTSAAVVVYFVCAAVAHLRSGSIGSAFWINCLGMLALSVAALVACVTT